MATIDISYMGLGPQAGYRVVVDGVGLRILSFDWFDRRPTSAQLDNFSKNYIDLLERFDAIPRIGESGLHEGLGSRDREIVLASLDIAENCQIPAKTIHSAEKEIPPMFVKYVKPETYKKYIKAGLLKVGSLVDYRFIPDVHAQDPLEGYCNLYFKNRKNYVLMSTFGGEDRYIFCGSNTLGSEHLMQEFGSVQLILNDVKGFGEAMATHLGAVDWEIYPVRYGKQKVWRLPSMHHSLLDQKGINQWIRSPEAMYTLHKFLSLEGPPGTIFYKPVKYSPERELRFVFRMCNDIGPPFWRSVNAPQLLDYFQVKMP